MNKRFSEEQIIHFLQSALDGIPIQQLCKDHGFSDVTFYTWRSKYAGMSVAMAVRFNALESEIHRLKKLLSDAQLDIEALTVIFEKQDSKARRDAVLAMCLSTGVSERRACRLARLSRSALHYQARLAVT